MLGTALLTPLSAPGSTTPVTLTRCKSALGITDSTHDTTLKALIRACAQTFAGVQGLQRDFWRRSWRVRTGAAGGVHLVLPVWPIESISAVYEGPDDYATTISSGDYEIAELEADRPQAIYRSDGWADSSAGTLAAKQGTGGDGELTYKVECIAGWLGVDQVSEWSASLAVTSGYYVRASTPSLYLFQAGSSGTMAASEPTWPTTLGGTVASNGVTFTARAARRLPDEIEEAALLTVKEWFGGALEIPAGIQSESNEVGSISYGSTAASYSLPPTARAVLAGWR